MKGVSFKWQARRQCR